MFLFRLLGPLLLLALLYWGLQKFRRHYALTPVQFKWVLLIAALLALVIVGVMLGRIPIQSIVAPIVLALTFLLRNIPLLIRLFPILQSLHRRRSNQRVGMQGDVSTISTRFLEMSLQHSSGDMDGEVLEGAYQGRKLSQMAISELLELAVECRADNDSLQLLEAFLDRNHAGWREGQTGAGTEQGRGTAISDESVMTAALARDILGLEPGASEEDVVAAHRRLMQKMHPDRGGSDYLAQKINA
ncbi:MAG: hypothetical protein RQ757_03340, partial [Pseudomonadales bacterium]|nr:hypothetical protein [Pseudomonadales bacterium]